MIALTQVDSSSLIAAHGYDPVSRTLAVQLRKVQTPLHYRDVPPETAEAFAKADSLGSFYGQNIRGKFERIAADAAS